MPSQDRVKVNQPVGDHERATPLFIAAYKGYARIVRALLETPVCAR